VLDVPELDAPELDVPELLVVPLLLAENEVGESLPPHAASAMALSAIKKMLVRILFI
jgi:hypothetical protein